MTHSELESWKWLWRRIAQLHKLFLICILLAVAESLTFPPIAWLIRRILDIAIPAKDSRQLVLLGLCIVAFNLASAGLAMGTRFLSTRTTKIAIGELRKFLIQRSFELPRSAHDTLDRGDLHALFVQDTQLVDVMINESLSILIPSAIISVLLVTVLAVVNFRLLFVLILVVPLLYLVNFRLKSVTMAWSQRARDSFARLSTGIHFVLQKLDLTRYQNAEHLEIRRQGNLIDAQRVDGEKMVLLQFGYAQLQSTIVATAGILILVVGGMQVEAGNLSLGTLLSFYVIFAMLGSNLQKLFGAIPHIVSGNQSLCALHSFCSLHVAPPYSGTTRFKFSGDIELCSVSFRYKSKDVFRGLSIKLNSGSFTAIMGPNGGGKTTIARLILGLYRPDEGVLRADGISYEKLDIERLRQSMAFAPQDPVLFTGTIWDNVSYGIPEEDAVHVKRACEIALVDDFVRYLPGGYNTEVGEDGGSLSGGQRQRIAIARALARCPRLLILDEPTNHLDPFTAQQLFRNLKSMLGACTALIITQDPAVARQAEFLYRLENGNLQRLEGASRFDNERFPEVVEREVIW